MLPLHQQCWLTKQGSISYILKIESIRTAEKMMLHCPGIEPEAQEWESRMLPLHQQCWLTKQGTISYILQIESIRITEKMMLHCLGIEPEAQEWESWMLPLHQQCCLLYTSPSPRDRQKSRMPSSA